MPNELLAAALTLWLVAAIVASTGRGLSATRALLALGGVCAIVAALLALPGGTPAVMLPTGLAGEPVVFRMAPAALWLMGFGLVPSVLACLSGRPVPSGQAGWLFGAALSLAGALGVFGLQNGAAFLISWEMMGLGGGLMLLGDRFVPAAGRPVLFMLALLEIGTVALLVAVALLASRSTLSFDRFADAALSLPGWVGLCVALLLVLGFGAKLGLLPSYEWFPAAYTAGSGATGAILSGVALNAAFFAFGRALLEWLPGPNAPWAGGFGIFLVTLAVLSAMLTALYAFQHEDWRGLLGLSSAENAAVAAAALGAALIFRGDQKPDLAALAWTVALLHMAGHALAKGCLFLAADGVFAATGSYAILHNGLLRRTSPIFGVGALFAAMSLAAMPPQAGFVSEWYLFQTFFQGFHLSSLDGRLVLALAGAGLALTVAVAFAAFVKLFGIGLSGRATAAAAPISAARTAAVGISGLAVLALATGMPWWLPALDIAVRGEFGSSAVAAMHPGPLLVPLTPGFAFISPSLLVVVMPLLAIFPLTLLAAAPRSRVRRVRVWYGGRDHDPTLVSTTALTFANALRTFYSFVYRPREETARETNGQPYFVRRLVFTHEVAPIFGPLLFSPVTSFVRALAERLGAFQSGSLNLYLAVIGILLVLILAIAA